MPPSLFLFALHIFAQIHPTRALLMRTLISRPGRKPGIGSREPPNPGNRSGNPEIPKSLLGNTEIPKSLQLLQGNSEIPKSLPENPEIQEFCETRRDPARDIRKSGKFSSVCVPIQRLQDIVFIRPGPLVHLVIF